MGDPKTPGANHPLFQLHGNPWLVSGENFEASHHQQQAVAQNDNVIRSPGQ